MSEIAAEGLGKILVISKTTWAKFASWLKGKTFDDAEQGKFVNDRSGFKYSKDYAKYKANDMRRFTTGKGKTFTDKSGYFFGETYFKNPKAKQKKGTTHTAGQRLKGYEGKSIVSRDVSHVNMILTGDTLEDSKIQNVDTNGFEIAYDPKDAGKIIGNQKRGYDIVGVSTENKELLKEKIAECFAENVREKIKKEVKINIG